MAKFIKTLITFCIALLVVFPVSSLYTFSGKVGAGSGIKVKINEKFLSFSQTPVRIKDGTTLLPFRPIYEFMGATISWDKNTGTVSASKGGFKVALQVENGLAVVNDERVIFNISSCIENGTTLVPAWFFAESLGAEVDWDAEQQVVNISLASVSGISLEKEELSLEQGETKIIAATVFPENAVNKNIRWDSTSPAIAMVNKAGNAGAVVTAINPGTTIIIATTEENNCVSTCRVTVEQAYTPVTGVYLNKNFKTLWEGDEPWTLTAKIYPESATNKNITWNSSKTGVASVHKQTANRCAIVPLKEGKAIVSVTTEDGKYTDICTITVLSD